MRSSIALLAAAATAAAAQTTVVNIWLPGGGDDTPGFAPDIPGDVFASVVDANPTATTYAFDLSCPTTTAAPGSEADEALLACSEIKGANFTLVSGPSTLAIEMHEVQKDVGASIDLEVDCSLDKASGNAVCTEIVSLKSDGITSSDTDSATISNALKAGTMAPLTVTAGIEKLSAATASAGATSAAAKPTSGASSAAAKPAAGAASGAASGTGAAPASTGKAGGDAANAAGRVGAAGALVAGAAALFGLVMVL